MKKIYLPLFLLVGLTYQAQILMNSYPSATITGSSVLFDASTNYSQQAGESNNKHKGLVIPSVDLVNFEFDMTLADGATFPTYFDGMIVYNRSTGTTLTAGNRSSTATAVVPGYYYFYNPNGSANGNVRGGQWRSVVNDATATSKGIIQLAGDLTGSSASPTIAANAVNSAKILDATIVNVDLAGGTGGIYKGGGSLSGDTTVSQGTSALNFTSTATAGTSQFTVDGNTLNVDAVNNRLGIGTSSPGSRLEINNGTTPGAIKIVDGTQGAGKVLVSDANGVGTWQSASGSSYTGSTSNILNGNSFERAALTGDVTAPQNSNATTISANAVTSAKILDGTVANADLTAGAGGIYKGDGSLAGNTIVTQGNNTLAFTSNITNGFSIDGGTFSVDAFGNKVGIGTTSPSSRFEVNGAATNTAAYNAGAGTTIDFSLSNLAYTFASPGSTFTLNNIKDGGTYSLAVKGALSGTATFSASGFTFKSASNGATVSNKETVYTFLVMGTTVYVYMNTGL